MTASVWMRAAFYGQRREGKEVTPEALSRGTLEQFYLALRLAAGRVVTREEAMPVFLDDAFVMYDRSAACTDAAGACESWRSGAFVYLSEA